MNPSPYPTKAEALEARRKTWRESKARRKGQTPAERRAEVEAFVQKMISSGAGPADRRETMLAILAARRSR